MNNPAHELRDPQCDSPATVVPTIQDMTVFRLYCAWSCANPIFVRLCEGRFNITRREWRILATIVHHDALPSSELARAAALDAARTSRSISTLVEKGWLQRRRSTKNARIVLISATESGRALYDDVMPEAIRLNRLLTQDLTASQIQTLHDALVIVQQRASHMLDSELISERSRRGVRAKPA